MAMLNADKLDILPVCGKMWRENIILQNPASTVEAGLLQPMYIIYADSNIRQYTWN